MMTVNGRTIPAASFIVCDTSGFPSPSQLLDVVDGRIAAIHMRDAISSAQRRALILQFQNSPGTHPRADEVPGCVLGADHYGKTYDTYMAGVDASEGFVDQFLLAGGDPVGSVLNSMQAALHARNITVRPARWRSRHAARARAVSWTGEGKFLLDPHEDVSQLTEPAQEGFEAQRAFGRKVIAVNIYPNVPRGGGALKVWNVIPDHDTRVKFGALHTGYPYPVESLNGIQSLEFSPASGSIVLMNGGLVHAVTGYSEGTSLHEHRLLVNFFMGDIDEHTMVHWV
jgi:hypothetical protein